MLDTCADGQQLQAESELKQVLRERIAQIEAMQTESTPPVESFMEDTRKAASG